MKVIYEFDLTNDADAVHEIKMFQQAIKMHGVLWSFAHNIKHRCDNLTGEKYEGYQLAMEHFFEFMKEDRVEI